jgi:YYY domain-containing protein
MSQAFLAFRWYLVVQVFGLAALPLCLRLFRHLPDRGYGVSKPMGLVLTGWTFWLLNTFGCTHNTAGGILVALAVLVIAGAILVTGHPTKRPIHSLSLRTVLVTEVVFTLAFALWCWVRSRMPHIQTAGGEKWMEIAFLRAILRSDTFPPHDPWLSGFAISYYYFGYVIVAMITRLASVPPPIAFNLGIATLFALVCTGSFSLAHNLVAAGSRSQISDLKPLMSGLLGSLLVAVTGNLEGLLEVLHARGIGPGAFWAWLDIRGIDSQPPLFAEGNWAPTRFFWWWQASRVLQDYAPWGAEQEVIDEFPVFSFILGDMHPHVLTLPFVLLALALALNLYLRGLAGGNQQTTGGEYRTSRSPFAVRDLLTIQGVRSLAADLPFAAWEFAVYALCLGGLGFLNTWDFPVYLFVVTAAYGLALVCTMHHHAPHVGYVASRIAFLFACLLVVGILLYLPFWLGFQSQAGGILINLFNGTRMSQFLVMFGPLAFIAVVFVIDQARRGGVQTREVARWTLIAALSILGVLMLVLGCVVLLVWLGLIPSQGAVAYLAAWLRGEPIPHLEDVADARSLISQRLLSRVLNPWTPLALIAFLVATVLLILKQVGGRERSACTAAGSSEFTIHNFVLLLFATGALLTLSVEYVFLRDVFLTRMNTVFKFYFQAWVMWGIAGAYALVSLFRRGRVGAVAVAALLTVSALVYPVMAIPARASEHGDPRTLDGAAYLAETHPDDYAAIAWLNENVRGAPVILEAPGGSYSYEGRVSAHTGLPTLLGWAGHEHQWRGSYDEQALREPDIETMYTSVDPAEVLALLDTYSISYVYVGPLERTRYPAAGLAKFAGLMDVVYDTGAVTIYRYDPVADVQP